MNRYTFEEQYTTFQTRGYSQEPSGAGFVGDAHALAAARGTPLSWLPAHCGLRTAVA